MSSSGSEPISPVFLACLVVFLIVFAYAFVKRRRARLREQATELGTVRGCTVEALLEGGGRRVVTLGVRISDERYSRTCLTPDDAKALAELLRVAATPGRTLAQARSNARQVAAVMRAPTSP